ncbi:MAG: porin family protein [Alphaproteobacteria bacterium]|nr:porin family protein [Alphaproteobacteria bacterium]MBR6685436.1 porin family protein [Alphaproteobacteria bacterium]
MKKLAISTLAVLMACPAFAMINHPDQGSSWQMWGLDPYVALRGGMSYTNLNYDFNETKESMTDYVFQGRAALGLEVCDTVRSEIEWSYFGKMSDSEKFGSVGSVDVETKMQTLLWNTFLEMGSYKIVRPFAGIGVGMAFADVKRKGDAIPNHSEDFTRFAAQGSLGMTFDMERFAVDVAARYTYVDVNSGLHNFGGDIGIRFMF